MLQNAGVFNILTCKCASRHSGLQFFDIKPPKSGPYPSVFHILTYKYASRHSRVPFLNIGTCKIGPRALCFADFDLQMCFAPQRRAIFEHRDFQNRSEIGVFCILTCKCASRHSRVPFLNIRTSKIGPRLWCFLHFDLQMCFAPQPRAIFYLSAEQLPPHPPL